MKVGTKSVLFGAHELQGVPLEHIAHLPKSHQFTLIGNAVPPVFAAGVMQAIFGGVL